MRLLPALLAAGLAALPLAASANLYDFTIATVDVSLPNSVAQKLGPISMLCNVITATSTFSGSTPIPMSGGLGSQKTVHVMVDTGSAVGKQWLCQFGVKSGGGTVSLYTYLTQSPAGKAALGGDVIAPNNKAAWFGDL